VRKPQEKPCLAIPKYEFVNVVLIFKYLKPQSNKLGARPGYLLRGKDHAKSEKSLRYGFIIPDLWLGADHNLDQSCALWCKW